MDLDQVLHHVQHAKLWPELVVVYTRLGKHAAALQLLVFNLRDLPAAMAYCRRLGPGGGEAVAKLAHMLLAPPDGSRPRLLEAAVVACDPRAKVAPMGIIERLDGEGTLAEALPVVELLLNE